MMPHVDVVILAAGSSRRFGSDKRLLLLQSVLNTVVVALGDTPHRLFLVLKNSDRNHLDTLLGEWQHHPLLQLVWNDHPEEGMGHSLALAAQQLQAPLAMVCLADMPFIEGATFRQLLQMANPDIIVVPVFHGRRGHPVCFGRKYHTDLQQLHGDSGARALLEQYADSVEYVDVYDAGILADIDTPHDWQQVHDRQPL